MWSRRSAGDEVAAESSVTAVTDEMLVEGLRSREREAFACLHSHYAPGIYNLALRMVRHGEDAEDITHDVLIRAFERVPRDREVVLKPWLYRMTVNRCYDHLRARKRHGKALSDRQREPRACRDPFEEAAQGRLFETALRGLTSRQRAAVLLRDVHGLSLPEVGAVLGIKTSSVEVLLARGRNSFRSRYVELCRAEGMPDPSPARVVLGLGLLRLSPLPVRLQSPPPPPALADPGLLSGLDPAVGVGLGAALGSSPLAKLAAALLAATTLAGAAEAVTGRDGPQSSRRPVAEIRVVAPNTDARPTAVGAAAEPATRGAGATLGGTTAVGPGTGIAPTASPSPSPTASPSPGTPPLGALAPTASPSPSPTASPTATPSPSPTPSETPDVAASPTPAESTEPSPSP